MSTPNYSFEDAMSIPQRQYQSFRDSGNISRILAGTGIGLGGLALLNLALNHKKTLDTAPIRKKPAPIPQIDEKQASDVFTPKPETTGLFANLSPIVNKSVDFVTGDRNSNPGINPSTLTFLSMGIPAALLGTLAYRNLMKKTYKPIPTNARKLDETSEEFGKLLSGVSTKKAAAGYIEALEDRYYDSSAAMSKVSTSLYEDVIPTLALAGVIPAAYYTFNKMLAEDPEIARAKAAREAMKRYKMLTPPDIKAVVADKPEEVAELNHLNNSTRTIAPIINPSTPDIKKYDESDVFGKMAEYKTNKEEIKATWESLSPENQEILLKVASFQDELSNLPPQELANLLQTIHKTSPTLTNHMLDELRKTNPQAIPDGGGLPLNNDQIIDYVANNLNSKDYLGLKSYITKRKLLSGLSNTNTNLPVPQGPSPYPNPPSHNAMNFMSNVHPLQWAGALGLPLLGYATGHPWMGAAGGLAALVGPQLFSSYATNRANGIHQTPWMGSWQKPLGPQLPPANHPNNMPSEIQGPSPHGLRTPMVATAPQPPTPMGPKI